jgi:PPOX class probable F420-dependent enzyme
MLNPDVRRVLDGTSIAHLATVLPDGSPHTTPVYVGAHGDRIVFFTGPGMRKARNLRRDPRVALSIAGGASARGHLSLSARMALPLRDGLGAK